jgi:RHS repeat-associated protein
MGRIVRQASEMSNDGHVLRAYVFMPDGYTPLLMIEYGEGEAVDGCYAYHNEHLSTPRAMTDDAGTGLYYNWHRYYVPGLGVHTLLDPIPRLGGANLGFARSNPVHWADPTGLAWVYVWGDTDGRYAHAAIESDDGNYLSFYPEDDGGPWYDAQQGAAYKSKEDDMANHAGEENTCAKYYVPGVDEDALSEAIDEFKGTNNEWDKTNNCVDAVMDVLDKAGLSIGWSDMAGSGAFGVTADGWLSALGLYQPEALKEYFEGHGYGADGCR